MNIYDDIRLPQPSKYLVSLLLKKGWKLSEMEGTNVYTTSLRKKELVFFGDFTPLIPYMYGIVFSNQKYWFEILKKLRIKFAWEPQKRQKKIRFMITKDGFYNALSEEPVVIRGDGKTNLGKLLRDENIRRINSKNKLLRPVKILVKRLNLKKVPADGESIELGDKEYLDITQSIDKKFIQKLKRIIEFLPGLSFLSFELFVKNPSKIEKFVIGKVSVTPGENIFLNLSNGKTEKDAGKIFVKYLVK
jgi:hypothetical protein